MKVEEGGRWKWRKERDRRWREEGDESRGRREMGGGRWREEGDGKWSGMTKEGEGGKTLQ